MANQKGKRPKRRLLSHTPCTVGAKNGQRQWRQPMHNTGVGSVYRLSATIAGTIACPDLRLVYSVYRRIK